MNVFDSFTCYLPGGDKSCLTYNNWQMSLSMIGASLLFRIPTIILFSLAFWKSRQQVSV